MKNFIVVDLDTEREGYIILGKPPGKGLEGWNGEPMIGDFATLLEAVCVVMRTMDENKIQDSATSLRNAINHLEKGSFDASLKATFINQNTNAKKEI